MSDQRWATSEDLDWDAIPDGPPPPLEDGIYRAVIGQADPQPTAKERKPAISVQLIVKQRHGSDEELNRRVFDTVVLTKEAAFRAKQLAKATQAELPRNTGYEAVSEFASSLVGSEVWIRTRQQTYNGRVNPRVDLYISEDKLAEVLGNGSGAASAAAEERPQRRKRGSS